MKAVSARIALPILVLLSAVLVAACSPTRVAGALVGRVPNISPEVFQPSAEIAQLADEATMTDKAKLIFYATNPEIDSDRAVFEANCRAPISGGVVELGCYTSDNRIYILAITTPQLRSEMAVTAAHEMLHAAYAQLSGADRATLDGELESAVAKIHSPQLTQELAGYRLLEPGQRDNELHSLLGTEYSPLPANLEAYYSAYFLQRSTVVADWQQFNRTFTQIEQRVNALEAQIQAMRAEMRADLRQRNARAYNALVPKFNALVEEYNQEVAQYNALSRSLMGQETPEGP